MYPSFWKLYLDDFPFFWFLSSSSRTRARAVWSLGDNGATNHHHHHCTLMNYRVIFLTGPAQKSSKYGTGPPQQQKMTNYTGPTQDTEDEGEGSILCRCRWWGFWGQKSLSSVALCLFVCHFCIFPPFASHFPWLVSMNKWSKDMKKCYHFSWIG